MMMNYGEKAKIIAYFDLILLIIGFLILPIVCIVFAYECSNSDQNGSDSNNDLTSSSISASSLSGIITSRLKPNKGPINTTNNNDDNNSGNGNNNNNDSDDNNDPVGQNRQLFIGFISRFVIAALFQLIMIILLLEGVLLQNLQRVWVWLVVNKIFLTITFVSGLIMLFIDPISVLVEVVCIIYKFFCLRIVNGFSVELQLQAI